MTKKDYKIDSKENSDYMYNIIEKILKVAPRRGSCTKGEKKGANFLAKELKSFCNSVDVEKFGTYPRLSVYHWIPRSALLISISTLLFVIFYSLNPLVISIISTSILIFNLFLVYKHYLCAEIWFPKFFFLHKKKSSQNIIGTIKPTGEIKKRLVFGAHIDSAQRFNIAHYFREAYIYFILGAILSIFTFLIVSITQLFFSVLSLFIVGLNTVMIATILNWIIIVLIPGSAIGILLLEIISVSLDKKNRDKILFGAISKLTRNNLILMILIITYLITINIILFIPAFTNPTLLKTIGLLFFNNIHFLIGMGLFASNKAVPGAADNLTVCAVISCIGKVLNNYKNSYPDLYPKNTEVILAMFGCEEVGSKGSLAFAQKHYKEYNKIDTSCIAMDTLGDSELINIFSNEGSTRVKYHPEVYNLLDECSNELNINHNIGAQPWISGGTDGSGLVKGGLTKTAAFVGLKYSDYLYYYHTDRDNLDLVNKKRRPCNDHGTSWKDRNYRCAMENAVKICIRYIRKKDSE